VSKSTFKAVFAFLKGKRYSNRPNQLTFVNAELSMDGAAETPHSCSAVAGRPADPVTVTNTGVTTCHVGLEALRFRAGDPSNGIGRRSTGSCGSEVTCNRKTPEETISLVTTCFGIPGAFNWQCGGQHFLMRIAREISMVSLHAGATSPRG